MIKAWTKQQSIVATSTAEAELYAGNRAATESMGVQALAKDLGRVLPIRLHIDSSQEAVRNNKLTVEKIPSETNSSGHEASHKRKVGDVDEARELLQSMRLWIRVRMTNNARNGRD